ncbi:MAG TPA: thiol peroxidase [Cyclobacteriaceae bacterium]|nr:thiol peroxidase [Cyclobacteriaceae bacterium]
MAQTKLGELVVNTTGSLPSIGSAAPDFQLTGNDLKDVSLKSFSGKNVVLNIFPSIDTGVCATSVREFNKRASALSNTVVLCISKDLPFAMKRFCGAEGIDKVITLSDFRSRGFTNSYGVEMTNGALTGLMARSVVVIGGDGKVKYHELVPAIGQEPNYDAALAAI